MHALRCERCEKLVKDNDPIYVINVRMWCEDCFKSAVLPNIKMSVKEYLNAYAIYQKNNSQGQR